VLRPDTLQTLTLSFGVWGGVLRFFCLGGVNGMKRWWIVFEILASLLGVVFFIDMLSGILFYIIPIWYIRSVMFLLSFVLIPAAVAFPIVIDRRKLLVIPAVIFPLVLTVIYVWESPFLVLFMCVLMAAIAVFGVVAGFVIRRINLMEGIRKNVIGAIGLLALLTPVLIMGYLFAGAPLHSLPVNRIVREYVAETHYQFDLVIGRTRYSIESGGNQYRTIIHYRNDREIYFEVWYTRRSGINDRFFHSSNWRQNYEQGRISRIE